MNRKGNNDPRKKSWSSYVSKLKSCKKRRKENCPICQKIIPALLYYKHVDKCSKLFEIRAKMYNEDVASLDRCVECAICLDDMECGQKIARLKCLCVYHKDCIDLWFNKNVSCPHHPK